MYKRQEEYLSDGEGSKKSNAKIQDAHEAIRPTDINRIPSELKESLSRDQFRLYPVSYTHLAWFYAGFRYQKCSGDISCAYEPDSLSEETRCDNS